MGKPSAPRPQDPRVTASAQTSSNIGTAIANQAMGNVNQVTPNGSLTYSQTGTHTYTDPNSGQVHEIPTYTATTSLSDGQQAIADQGEQAGLNMATLAADSSGRLQGMLGSQIDSSGLPQAGQVGDVRNPAMARVGNGPALQQQIAGAGDITRSYGTDFGAERSRVENALMSRMRPQMDQDRARLESRLASQGIRVGSDAYASAMGDQSRAENDARMSAVLGAGQEQSRLTALEAQRAGFENSAQAQQFGQNAQSAGFGNATAQQGYQNRLTGAGFNNSVDQQGVQNDAMRFGLSNTARQNALQERFALRSNPINEITALMSGSQVQGPNFVNANTGQMAGTNVAGIQQNYDGAMQNRYNTQLNQWNQVVGGIANMGANLMMSDKRTKTDIKKVGKTNDGQQIYSYRYKTGGPIQMGLMAQNVEKVKPDAVETVGGIKMVDYGKALS